MELVNLWFVTDATGPVIGILVVIGVCLCVNGLLVFSARRVSAHQHLYKISGGHTPLLQKSDGF